MKTINALLLLFLISITSIYCQNKTELIPFRKGDYFGFVDKNKNIIIKPTFINAYPFGYSYNDRFFPDYALVQIEQDMFLVDKQGNLILENKFNESCDSFPMTQQELQVQVECYKYTIFEKNGKKGLLDENNKIVLEPIYSNLDIYYFSEKYYNKKTKKYFRPTFAVVSVDGKSSIIRIDKFIIYDNVSVAEFASNSNHIIVWVKKYKTASKNGILLKDKLILIKPEYSIIHYYENQGLIYVSKVINEHPGNLYIDLNGNEYYEK